MSASPAGQSKPKNPDQIATNEGPVNQSNPQKRQVSMQWEGPLPPPGALREFNALIPDGADRIMKLVEGEQSHRHSMEDRLSKAEVFIEVGVRILGAVVLIVSIIAAIVSIYLGADWKATVAFLSLPIMGTIAKVLSGVRAQAEAFQEVPAKKKPQKKQ